MSSHSGGDIVGRAILQTPTTNRARHTNPQQPWVASEQVWPCKRRLRLTRTETTKRASRVIIEKFYPRLTLDFQTNKRIVDEVSIIPSKRLRNKIAGFTTHLMKRIQRGPVHGISFKLQEEERERKDQYVPEVSALDGELVVDRETKELLQSLGYEIPVTVVDTIAQDAPRPQFRGDRRR